MTPIAISAEEARRFLIGYHHLTDQTALTSLSDVPDFVKKVGCIQFDPLNPAGRNHDLVLQARLPGYRKGDIDRLLYEERVLIDQWDKNMAICHVADWPAFARMRAHSRTAPRFDGLGEEARALARALLAESDYLCSADVPLNDTTDQYWGTQRIGRMALEALYFTGEAAIHHKRGSRRYYSLTERLLPPELIAAPDPHPDDTAYHAHMVRRRIGGIGLLWNRGGDAWLGIRQWKPAHREAGFSRLLEQDAIRPLSVDGIPHPLYIPTEHLPQLEALRQSHIPPENIRILGPLDSFIWERKLIADLFDFDYRWEVYTPEKKRRYGWYVLPVIAGERFVARIELATDKKAAALIVRNIWWEPGADKKALRAPLRAALKRFMVYNRCKSVRYECRL